MIPVATAGAAAAFREELPTNRIRIIDAAFALSMRPDCRRDPLHLKSHVLINSQLRMLQNAVGDFGVGDER